MANTKISGLTTATTPLAGTEVLPIVQSSTTKQVSVANLTAGRTVQMTGINDANNNPLFKFTSTASAVNELTYANAATGGSPTFSATGTDTNISIALTPKGSGRVLVTAGSLQVNTGEFSLGSGGANGFVSGNTWYGINTGNWVFQAGNGTQSFVWANSSGTTQATLASNTGNMTLNTGNLVQGTAAKGINFTANSAASGMTSQLLNWYEEGTWTPTDNSGAGLTFDIRYAKYTRIGRAVHIVVYMVWPTTSNTANASLDGLPFSVPTNGFASFSVASGCGTALGMQANSGATTLTLFPASNYNLGITNATLSGGGVEFSGTYFIS